jgi:hypothetical protein
MDKSTEKARKVRVVCYLDAKEAAALDEHRTGAVPPARSAVARRAMALGLPLLVRAPGQR